MKQKITDKNMPIGALKRADDFLPPPSKLVMPERTTKVTLRLSEQSIAFFKEQAKKHRTKYQKMMRTLLDQYAKKYS